MCRSDICACTSGICMHKLGWRNCTCLTWKICLVVISRCVFFWHIMKCQGMKPPMTQVQTHIPQRFVSTRGECFIFFVFAIWEGKGVESRCEKSGRFWLPLSQTQVTDGLGWCLLNIRSEHWARTLAASSAFCLPFNCECLFRYCVLSSLCVLLQRPFPFGYLSSSILLSLLCCSFLCYFASHLNGCLVFDCRDRVAKLPTKRSVPQVCIHVCL